MATFLRDSPAVGPRKIAKSDPTSCASSRIILNAGQGSLIDPKRPRGGVVTQRTANPCTPVQFRARPPNNYHNHLALIFFVVPMAANLSEWLVGDSGAATGLHRFGIPLPSGRGGISARTSLGDAWNFMATCWGFVPRGLGPGTRYADQDALAAAQSIIAIGLALRRQKKDCLMGCSFRGSRRNLR